MIQRHRWMGWVLAVGLFLAPERAAGQEAVSELISLNFKGADVSVALQAVAKKGNVNIVTGPEVIGPVTIQLNQVTWEQALDAIIKMTGFAYEKEDNVILVSTVEEILIRHDAARQLAEVEPAVTKIIQLRFLDAVDVLDFLEPQLSPQGRISILETTGQKGWAFGAAVGGGASVVDTRERRERENSRSKSIVLTDNATTVDRLMKVLATIDVMPEQILIQSRIMEVNNDLLRDLGLEIGTGPGSTAVSTRSASFQSLKTFDEGADKASFAGSVLNQALSPSVFVPQTTGLTSANTGLDLVFRLLRGTQVELLIRALEEDVSTNTLSAPHILTLSGQEARILIGEKFPILNTQVSGTSTAVQTTTLDYYQDIGIELFVVPQVAGEKHIDMIIHPVVSARTGTVGDNQYPILNVREAETQVVMEDGETIVIGGLLKDVKAKSQVGLPFLGKIPVLGHLFSRHTTDTEKIDLLIFITAHRIEPGSLSPEEVLVLQRRYEGFLRERFEAVSGQADTKIKEWR